MRTAGAVLAVTFSALLIGCASTQERPSAALAAAQTSIQLAEQNDAQEHSAAELAKAREKLTNAQRLAENGDNDMALRLASEARVDARLASALALSAKNSNAASEIQESLATLERELSRASVNSSYEH